MKKSKKIKLRKAVAIGLSAMMSLSSVSMLGAGAVVTDNNTSINYNDDYDYDVEYDYGRREYNGFAISVTSAATAKIVGFIESHHISSNENPNTLYIPSKIAGLTITEIGYGAFSKCKFAEVVIPDTVTAIRKNAFKSDDYSSICEITIPESVTFIDEEAFGTNPDNEPIHNYFYGDLNVVHNSYAQKFAQEHNIICHEIIDEENPVKYIKQYMYDNSYGAVLMDYTDNTADITHFDIPAKIDGYPVIGIDNTFFQLLSKSYFR